MKAACSRGEYSKFTKRSKILPIFSCQNVRKNGLILSKIRENMKNCEKFSKRVFTKSSLYDKLWEKFVIWGESDRSAVTWVKNAKSKEKGETANQDGGLRER